MFTVGEFSRLAQVSKRSLRFYDEIGLLKPAHVDPSTGYRFYSAAQMPTLNRILALKELDLSLDQIRQIMHDKVSIEELHGMLLLKKAEIEGHLQEELQRILRIESRLQSVRDAEANRPLNVVIKRMPAQSVLSTRTIVETFEVGVEYFRQIRATLPERSPYGLCFCICHDDGLVERDMDLEFGCLIETKTHVPVGIHEDLVLRYSELPAANTMATTVVEGALETIHTGYTEIGLWVEANGYRLAGMPRELSLQLARTADGHDLITEIQFPVEPLHIGYGRDSE